MNNIELPYGDLHCEVAI